MKFRDVSPDKGYRYEYHWYITDEGSAEFMLCDNCRSEAPLHNWRFSDGNKWHCEICSNAPSEKSERIVRGVIVALNNALRIAGVFDNYDVLIASEERP